MERGDDTGTLLSHDKQKTISLTWKHQVIMHSSVKFSLTSEQNDTLKRAKIVMAHQVKTAHYTEAQ